MDRIRLICRKESQFDIIIRLILLICSFAICYTMRTVGDDFVFQDSMNRFGSFFAWMAFYSENWSGRVIPHGLLVLLLQFPHIFFVIINSIFLYFLPIQIVNLFAPLETKNKTLLVLLLWIMVLLLSTRECFANAVLWKCASVLYLWGQVAFFFAVRPLVMVYKDDVKPSGMTKFLAVIGGVYASSFEQIAAIMFCFMIVLDLWNMIVLKRVNYFNSFLTIFVCCLSVFFVKMSGNSVRTVAETIRWMPDYPMLTIWDKLFYGIVFCIDFIRNKCSFIMMFLSIILFVYIKNNYSCHLFYAVSLFTMVYYGLNSLCWFTENRTYTDFYLLSQCFSFIEIGGSFFSVDVKHLFTSLAAFFSLMSVVSQLFLVRSEEKNYDILKPLLFLSGCGTVILMAFSPTIYASGERVLFIAITFLSSVFIITFSEIFIELKRGTGFEDIGNYSCL